MQEADYSVPREKSQNFSQLESTGVNQLTAVEVEKADYLSASKMAAEQVPEEIASEEDAESPVPSHTHSYDSSDEDAQTVSKLQRHSLEPTTTETPERTGIDPSLDAEAPGSASGSATSETSPASSFNRSTSSSRRRRLLESIESVRAFERVVTQDVGSGTYPGDAMEGSELVQNSAEERAERSGECPAALHSGVASQVQSLVEAEAESGSESTTVDRTGLGSGQGSGELNTPDPERRFSRTEFLGRADLLRAALSAPRGEVRTSAALETEATPQSKALVARVTVGEAVDETIVGTDSPEHADGGGSSSIALSPIRALSERMADTGGSQGNAPSEVACPP